MSSSEEKQLSFQSTNNQGNLHAKKTKNYARNSNFELLRIVAIFFVVFGHVYNSYYSSYNNWFIVNLGIFYPCAVPIFGLITGFFMVNNNKNRFIRIFSLFIVYYIVNWLMGSIFILTINKNDQWVSLITGGRDWWYFWSIMLIYFIAPILNYIFTLYNLKQIIIGIIIFYTLFMIFDGIFLPFVTFHSVNFLYLILVYLIGGVIKKSEIILLNKKFFLPIMISLLVAIMLTVNLLYVFADLNITKIIFFQTSPIVLMISIVLFTSFYNINFKSKIINFLAVFVLTIYLFHSWFEQGMELLLLQKIKDFFSTPYQLLFFWLLIILLTFIFALIIYYPTQKISLRIEKIILYSLIVTKIKKRFK